MSHGLLPLISPPSLLRNLSSLGAGFCSPFCAAPPQRRRTALAPTLCVVAAKNPRVTPRYHVCVAAAATGMGQGDKEEEGEELTEETEPQTIARRNTEEAAPRAADGEVTAQAAAMPGETEATVAAGQQQQMVSEEVEEVVEQVVEPLTFRLVASRSQTYLTTTLPGKLILGGLAVAFLGTLLLATYRAWQKSNTAQAKRMRQIDRNRDLVEGLNKYLLNGNRAGLTPGVLRKLQRASGFSAVEVFRKYLWYLLRERKFDQGAVEDLVAMKVGLELSDADVGEALRERATRIYDKYGTLMLNTEGLTLSGAQRKATCTSLFRKVLYLAECDRLVGPAANEPGGSGAGSVADIGKPQIFGATIEDMERLRIRNLYEAELDLEGMIADSTDDDGPAPPASEGPSKAGRR
ncbi:hypothetical protein VOLCADRAFT_116322 [Volvox carteri f. nagariensis]|uniref:Armadillo-like repeats domain-containing protein n=1 Tax=Volvox carteri f. nagariensis TaxID=3068 RepID=D8TL49_VOLCA|nr:uncharacterized protein VOLCADRAFT_116322 [Volvox carteri f. nagariensis]EFJ51676.1 hypothetical protein VOLCADRAFT_116322 [Volvox carteri f. nagariensis]|eukprot:XP_002947086.1 hypothetical protein VOLCADRAFT_116322 [Volvox carteri f. nagariensis]